MSDKEQTVTTWKETRESLGDGISDETLELIRRATAQQRHEARVKAARQAALQELPDPRLAGVLCVLEEHGHGGPWGAGSFLGLRATLRAEWARGLGSGRAQAGDGPAWDAAIRDAGIELMRSASTRAQDVLDVLSRTTDPVVAEEARAYARARIYDIARLSHISCDPGYIREWDQVIRAVAERMVPVEAEAPNVPSPPEVPQ